MRVYRTAESNEIRLGLLGRRGARVRVARVCIRLCTIELIFLFSRSRSLAEDASFSADGLRVKGTWGGGKWIDLESPRGLREPLDFAPAISASLPPSRSSFVQPTTVPSLPRRVECSTRGTPGSEIPCDPPNLSRPTLVILYYVLTCMSLYIMYICVLAP